MSDNYDVVAVSVTMQSGAAPLREEIGSIKAEGLGFGTSLNREGFIEVSCKPETLGENVKSRLRDLVTYPTELRVYRGSVLMHAGPILGLSLAGEDVTLSIHAAGILYYLRTMFVTSDLVYSGIDQYTIGAGLVDHWQSLTFGDYGIDVSGVGTSGITRTRDYLAIEQNNVYDRLIELSEVTNGFDFDFDPSTMVLDFVASKGTDRSSTVVLDRRNISDPAIQILVSADSVASDVQAVSTGSDPILTSAAGDAGVRTTLGRRGAFATFDGVSVQATLDDKASALLAGRTAALIRPSSTAIPLDDMDVNSFDVGDQIGYAFDSGIGLITGTFRVNKKTISVGSDGTETLTVGFE